MHKTSKRKSTRQEYYTSNVTSIVPQATQLPDYTDSDRFMHRNSKTGKLLMPDI